jgi:prepilin-type N-terminal cleavage/methylation domain-containing protein
MSTSVRARQDERGFSFVELLVTIIIAAIIFAAMVPVFVMATQKNSSDSLRLQAANVAQDKIEKVRQLAYGAIAANSGDLTPNQAIPNLYDPEFADRQFGSNTVLSTGSGNRTIHTDYNVVLYPAVSTGLASQYKVVTVTAYWDGPPAPVKRVVLQTIVYRQYAGPPITDFSTAPLIYDDGVIGHVGTERDTLTSVTLSAHVDLSSGVTLASLQFKVSAYGGQTIASQMVKVSDLIQGSAYYYDGHGTFYWTWDCTYADNTVYDLQATAFSADGFAGNTPHQYPSIAHILPPSPPGAVTATPGDKAVDLSWALSTAPLLASYEIARANSATGPWNWTPTPLATVLAPATTYPDRDASLVNGTTYYYAVRAVTSDGRHSAPAVSNAVTPILSSDNSGPTAPGSVAATRAPAAATITLTWTLATDPGTPSSGVAKYEIWRSADGVNWGALPLATWTNLLDLTYPDASAGWATTWYYKIRAVDGALNPGLWSPTVSATTVVEPFHDLHISVKSGNNACNVWVLKSGDHYYDVTGADRGTNPPTGTAIAKNGSVTFTHLPDGAYIVYAATGSSPGTKTYGVVVQAPFGSLTNVTP